MYNLYNHYLYLPKTLKLLCCIGKRHFLHHFDRVTDPCYPTAIILSVSIGRRLIDIPSEQFAINQPILEFLNKYILYEMYMHATTTSDALLSRCKLLVFTADFRPREFINRTCIETSRQILSPKMFASSVYYFFQIY